MCSSDLSAPRVARGAAYADIDNDGDLDLLITTNAGPPLLFRNDGGNRNHALRVKLRGTSSNRDGIGAVVRIEYAGEKQWQMLRSGSSYLSQSELVLTFGLGEKTRVASLRIEWPSGKTDQLTNVAAELGDLYKRLVKSSRLNGPHAGNARMKPALSR